ncbi:hypothetical protein B7494_g8535 [Chlorociboria aeruginascens]|nr:hypothetical protein B7494_g8535 [Chlorociboria aeruginascens]
MDNNGPPEQKRPKLDTLSGSWQHDRSLPPPQPHSHPPHPPGHPPYRAMAYRNEPQLHHQPHPIDTRRPEFAQDPDPRRSSSGPPPHGYHGLPQPGREPPVKREVSPPPPHRIPSTGSAQEYVAAPHHMEESRRHYATQFNPSPGGGSPFQHTPAQPYPQSPMSSTTYNNSSMYATSQDQYAGVSYPISGNNQQKRKAQRAAQACDSCRSLKAKCDEGRPTCTSCREKGIPCNYRDPPPKAYVNYNMFSTWLTKNRQDKVASEIMDSIMKLQDMVTQNFDTLTNNVKNLSHKVETVENIILSNVPNAEVALKQAGMKQEVGDSEDLQNVGMDIETQPSNDQYNPISNISGESRREDELLRFAQIRQEEARLAREQEEDAEPEGEPVSQGVLVLPVNHTTGAARLVLNGSIDKLVRAAMPKENEKYPLVAERRRGVVRLYGRGEEKDKSSVYDKDSSPEQSGDTYSNDGSSDVSTPPPGEEFGQLGGLTPPAPNSEFHKGTHIAYESSRGIARGVIEPNGMPDFSRDKVWSLVKSYKDNMNIMHPIIVERKLDIYVELFLRSIEMLPKPKQLDNLKQTASFISQSQRAPVPESPGSKRKRSPGFDQQDPATTLNDLLKPGHPFRTMSTALVLMVLALGKICLYKDKIPDVVPERDPENYSGSPATRNGHPLSPNQSSPGSNQHEHASPIMQPGSRRSSHDGFPLQRISSKSTKRNMDVIPGMEYFALGTDIIGNQVAGATLTHVHVNILAGLYHGQLARPLESHGYIALAAHQLLIVLGPRLERLRKLQKDNKVPLARDNPYLIAFWTCLILESDIVAELPLPYSRILEYEDDMPLPNLASAVGDDGFDVVTFVHYIAQLTMRKHLNKLHAMFYKPESDATSKSHFDTIEACELNIADLKAGWIDNKLWIDDGEPAKGILEARLRAKYYGAQVITYRNFLLEIIEHMGTPPEKSGKQISQDYKSDVKVPQLDKGAKTLDEIEPKVIDYAKKSIEALINSTTAFYGLESKRLIITNVWGTAHAQFGNLLVLQAVYQNELVKHLINRDVLRELLEKTISFLKSVAHPTSALSTDVKILIHTGTKLGLLGKENQSFTSVNSDTPMTDQ